MTWLAAARTAASAAIRGCKTQLNNATHQQTRNMGGGGPSLPWYRSLDGRPPPPEFQSPEFVTYAGLTLPKRKVDYDWYISKVAGAAVWFTMLYHFSINWEEHWHGDIWVFEKDVQSNGWDDEHGHGHGHKHH